MSTQKLRVNRKVLCTITMRTDDRKTHTADIVIRGATAGELPSLQEIERAAAMLFPPGRLPDPDDAMPLAELARGREAGLLLVAVLRERIVGFAMSQVHAPDLHLAVMAVHPDAARRGIGRQLLGAVIDEARERRMRAVTLTTFGDLPFNAPFYASAGFHPLEDSALTPVARAALEHERRLGMTSRIAMIRLLSERNPSVPVYGYSEI